MGNNEGHQVEVKSQDMGGTVWHWAKCSCGKGSQLTTEAKAKGWKTSHTK
jgi:hypothetical protein